MIARGPKDACQQNRCRIQPDTFMQSLPLSMCKEYANSTQLTCVLSSRESMATSHCSTVHTSCIKGSAKQIATHQAHICRHVVAS